MDFVNQLQVGVKDLEETGRLGFADGISKIFIDGLNINYLLVNIEYKQKCQELWIFLRE